MEYICFVPGCTNVLNINNPKSPSYYTFHRLPQHVKYLGQLLVALDLPDTTETDSESVMCSAHFGPIIEHVHLVRYLLDGMIQEKPSLMAVSSAPRCAASVAGCCMNLYSGVALFKFPEAGRSFDLWRMVAGSPPIQDCQFLCARHFKRNSFAALNMEELIEGSIPVYPTRPLHPVHMNYRPLKKPIVRSESPTVSNVIDPYQDDDCTTSKPKYETKKKWRCAAVGCDVTNESHPDMRKINMPPYKDRLSLWREIVGDTPTTKYNNSLCTRHFGINQFYDGESRKHFVKMTNPVYPTGPLNMNTMDYCPPELDITLAMENDGDEDLVVVTLDDDGQSETEIVEDVIDENLSEVDTVARCSSVGCPVASKTHPNVKIFNFPYKSPKRIKCWLRIAGKSCIRPLRLCERHFDTNNRELIPKYPFWDLDPKTKTYRPKFDPANPSCCVPGCSPPDDEDVSYHRFPLDKQAFKVWVQRIGWKQLELYEKGDVFRGFRVCSLHFSRSWFTTGPTKECVLRPGAIPTLFPSSDNLKEKFNEEDISYEVALIDSPTIGEGSYVASTSSDLEESNFRQVKKRRSSQQGQQSPKQKKPKLTSVSPEPPSESADEDIVGLQASSIKNEDVSFWIESPASGRIEGNDSNVVKREWMVLDSKVVIVDSRLNDYSSGGSHLDANESHSVQNTEEPVHPDTDDLSSEGDCDYNSNDVSEEEDCNIIEESETCELWTKSSHIDKQFDYDVLERDFLGTASRLCDFDTIKVEKLRLLTGKNKNAMDKLEELLVEHLEHVISITGVDFLKKCFEHVVNGSSKKPQKQQEVPEDIGKFESLCNLSQRLGILHSRK